MNGAAASMTTTDASIDDCANDLWPVVKIVVVEKRVKRMQIGISKLERKFRRNLHPSPRKLNFVDIDEDDEESEARFRAVLSFLWIFPSEAPTCSPAVVAERSFVP